MNNVEIIEEGSTTTVSSTIFDIVRKLPSSLEKMESETEVRVAEIEFEDGILKTIPRANLEIILS